jgi:hypothetical protein
MPVEAPSFLAHAIEEHLELKRKNSELEESMPLERYKDGDPFRNHPLFKTEEQARLEETMDDVAAPVDGESLTWPADEAAENSSSELEESLWSRSRDFDWGD